MRQRAFRVFVALFAALLAVTAAAKGSSVLATAESDPGAEPDPWIESASRSTLQGAPTPFRSFDDLLSDRFFSRGGDPFAEMLELQNRLDFELGGQEKALFGQSWNDWLGDGMDVSSIQEKTRETGKEVVVELKIAGLDKDSLEINVDDSRIRVAYDAEKVENRKDGNGREIFKRESIRHFEKTMPIPANADSRNSRIAREGEVVKIIFRKKEGAVKADA